MDKNDISEYLKENPDVLRNALKNIGVRTGTPAYELIKKEKGTYISKKLVGTKIVDGKEIETTFYTFRLPNGSIVRLPEHCLEDYNIRLDKVPMFEDEGDK